MAATFFNQSLIVVECIICLNVVRDSRGEMLDTVRV